MDFIIILAIIILTFGLGFMLLNGIFDIIRNIFNVILQLIKK